MKNMYLANRDLARNYMCTLREYLDEVICPEKFSQFDPENPQKFYLEFKNLALDVIDKETISLQKELLKSENSHLILLKRTGLIDVLVEKSLQLAVWLYNFTHKTNLECSQVPVAILGLGGYGREEKYFLSDVGLQIIHSSMIANDQDTQIAHSVINNFEYLFIHQDIFPSTINSCYAESSELEKMFTQQNLTNFFSLMEHRFITGNQMVYAEFSSAIKTAILLHKDEILEECYQQKHLYDIQNTVFQQEPNVKEELSRLYWALALVRIHHNLEKINQFEILFELYEKNILSAPAFKNMQNSFNFMSKVRLLLHCCQKGAHRDVLSFEVRERIAENMGFGLKAFYQHYFYQAGYPLKRYSRNLFLESMASDTRKVKSLSEHFALNIEDQIIFDAEPEKIFEENPHWMFQIFSWVAENNYHLSYPVIRSIEQNSAQMSPIFVDENSRWEIQECFKRIIEGRYYSRAIRLLHEFDLLGEYFIPEFKDVCGLLQDIYVHKFPTDIHILSALDALNSLETEEDVEPFLVELYESLKNKITLKLAVVLHDIGKGVAKPGENEELIGAYMVPGILGKLGFPSNSPQVKDIAFLVEKHLTMYDLMLLDPEDDETFELVWDLVDQDKERFKMLILLTFADRAGTKMKMSPSQIQQLKMFFQFTIYHRRHADVPQSVKLKFLEKIKLPKDLQSQLDVYYEFSKSPDAFSTEMIYKPDQPSELVVCGKDKKGFLFNVAAILAFNHLNITSANVQTIEDDVFDVFSILDASGKIIDPSNFYFVQKQVAEDLHRIFVDKEIPSQVFKDKSLMSGDQQKKFNDIKLKFKIIGRSIKLSTHDVIGTFMVETKVFSQFNIEIQKAVLHSNQETASTIFYIRPEDVQIIINKQDLFIKTLKNALQQLLEGNTSLLEEGAEPR
jgi:UTP:GlnB (protein PII) uridylyltransferase